MLSISHVSATNQIHACVEKKEQEKMRISRYERFLRNDVFISFIYKSIPVDNKGNRRVFNNLSL